MCKLYLFDGYEHLSEEFIARSLAFLPADRRIRALRYRRRIDRWNCVVAYLMLLYGLRECFGITTFKIAFGEYGKPYLPEYPQVHFNISHCDTGCAVAVADCHVGVDIQDVRPFSWDMARRVCCEQEITELEERADQNELFTEMWTMKESYGQMIGLGLLYELQSDCCEKERSAYIQTVRVNGKSCKLASKSLTPFLYVNRLGCQRPQICGGRHPTIFSIDGVDTNDFMVRACLKNKYCTSRK